MSAGGVAGKAVGRFADHGRRLERAGRGLQPPKHIEPGPYREDAGKYRQDPAGQWLVQRSQESDRAEPEEEGHCGEVAAAVNAEAGYGPHAERHQNRPDIQRRLVVGAKRTYSPILHGSRGVVDDVGAD